MTESGAERRTGTSLAEELLREGRPDEALSELQGRVRANPNDVRSRIFLFQLLAVNGAWSRSLNQLEVAGEMDPGALAMVQTYREALKCEVLRGEVFSGKRSPVIFGDPSEWHALLIEALRLGAEGRHDRAGDLRDRALQMAPATGGAISMASPGAGESDAPEIAFAWMADADTRIGPVLEVILNGRYVWVPFDRIREIRVEAPADLRDLVWTPARFLWTNGGDSVGLIPTRYPGSESSEDGRVRLARRTEWMEGAGGAYFGFGQRILATDVEEHPLMDVRRIAFASGTSESAGATDVSAANASGPADVSGTADPSDAGPVGPSA